MARPRHGARVLGPYEHAGRWRIRIIDPEGRRSYESVETEAEALKLMRVRRRQMVEETEARRTLEQAIDAYEVYLWRDKGNKKRSAFTTVARLRSFFPDTDERISAQTPKRCAAHYARLTERVTRFGRPMAVDSHRNTLAEAKTFFNWCVGQRWLRSNPLSEVKGRGRRRHGKPQLRIDEARRWIDKGIELADEAMQSAEKRRQLEGVAVAMCTLLLGTRSLETTTRVVRDLDDRGRRLWIDDTKTAAGRRTLEVPAELRPYLLRLAEGKEPNDLLFGWHDRAFPRRWVQRICRLADVPVVGAHAMRGLSATLSIIGGFSVREAAARLGHAEETTTLRSYADREQVGVAQQRGVLRALQGEREETPGTETNLNRSQSDSGG